MRTSCGARVPFTDNGDGSYTPDPGVLAVLIRTGDVGSYTYTITASNQTVYSFDNAGQIISERDPAGRSISYTYFISGPLQTVADATGLRYLNFGYDAQDRLISVADSGGRLAQYGYDVNGDQVVFTDTRGLPWTYAYSGTTHLLSQITDPDGRIVEQTTFDGQGRAVAQVYGHGNSVQLSYPITGTTLITDARGFKTTDAYNSSHVLVSQTLPTVAREYKLFDGNFNLAGTSDPNGNDTWLYWSDNGYNLERTRDALGNETQLTYDALNNVTQTVDARGLTTTLAYSGTLLTSRTDALGRTWVYTYGVNGLLVAEQDPLERVAHYEYDQFGQRTAVTDTLGNTTRYAYDDLGRLITTTNTLGQITVNQYDPAGHLLQVTRNYLAGQPQNWQGEYNLVTQYAYDGAGRQVLITDTLGRASRNEYDTYGRLVTVTQNYLPGQSQNYLNQYNLMSFTGYDAAGNVVTRTDTLGRISITRYDSLNRPITTTTNYVDGVFVPNRPDEDILTANGYDAAGNVITQTDALGRMTRTWYDALNRPIMVTANYSSTRPQNYLSQYNIVMRYGYDQVGNRALVTDTLGRVSRTEYDSLNRPFKVTQNYLPGQPQNYQGLYNLVTTYGFDEAGNRVVVTDTLGRSSFTTYDDLNRVIAQTDAAGSSTQYGYDALGNRAVITDALGNTTQFAYDTLNRVITTTRPLDGTPITSVTRYDALGNRVQTIDGRGNATSFGYDALNRSVVITDAKSHTMTFAYDALGRRLSQSDGLGHTAVYTYDLAGRQIRTQDAGGNVTAYAHDVLGNRLVVTDANGIATRYEYDALSRLSAVVENYSPGQPTNHQTNVTTQYAYDPLGNRTVITNALGYTTTFSYDALDRLVAQADPLGNTPQYGYDVLGNRTVMTDANNEVTLYTYDVLNRLTVINYTADQTTVQYAYDKVGNRTVMTDSVGVTRYTYDDLYRLTNVVDPYSQAITYTYDAVGSRTNLFYPDGRVVTYTYDALNLMSGVIDWSGGTTAYAYDAANRLITTTLPNGVRTVYAYDDASRLMRLTHTRLGDSATLADYQFALDKVGNRTTVTETLLYPDTGGGGLRPELGALPTQADEVAEAVTGHRAPGVSALVVETNDEGQATEDEAGGNTEHAIRHTPASFLPLPAEASSPASDSASSIMLPIRVHAGDPALNGETAVLPLAAPPQDIVAAPLQQSDAIFSDGFESGNFSAWSATITNTGRLSVTTPAARFGAFGMRALITNTTAMYARDDTPNAESRYRARFYFHTNSITITSGNAHYIFAGRSSAGTDVLYVEFRYSSPNYQVRAQIRNDSTVYSNTNWYTISNAWHFIETDWKASSASGANNGYLSLWIDDALKQTLSNVDNDTRRVDEARLGPLSGIDSGTSGTEYFDAFVSRRTTYIGPVVAANFSLTPTQGLAPLAVTFTNTSQPTATITAYLWNFGDGYTSTITNPVHAYPTTGNFTVTLTAFVGSDRDTLTKTNAITVTSDLISADGFESGNLLAWSAAVTNSGRLAVKPAAALFGTYGLSATFVNTTSMYVRDDTPNAEARYRARFYFNPNTINMASGNAHYIFAGRTGSTDVLYVEFRYSSPNYQIRAQIRNDSTTYSSTNWYTIAKTWHFIEIDWKAATAAGANNGYISLWIDDALMQTVSGIDNDTRRVDEARLGPLSGIDSGTSGTSGTEYFDAFESRRSAYIGPLVTAGFTANPAQGVAPLTVTFTNTSLPTTTITSYLWQFGDGYTDTITHPVHVYATPGYYTVTLTAFAGSDSHTLTKTNFITATVKADFSANPVEGAAPLTVTFTNASQPAASITSYLWQFGDGVTSTITNPVHIYAASGYYSVALTAYAGIVENTITKTNFITVATGLGEAIALATDPNVNEETPALAYNPDDQHYLLTWREWDGQFDIYARRVLSSGQPTGSSFAVFSDANNQQQPAVVYGDGVYLVAWEDAEFSEVWGQLVLPTGVLTGTASDFGSGGSGNTAPAVDYNPVSGEFIVAWAHDIGFDNNIWAQRMSTGGEWQGFEIVVSSLGGHELQPAVAHDASGTYLVVFMCEDGNEFGVCGRRVSSSGSPVGDVFTIYSGSMNSNAPDVAYNAQNDEYLVAWRESTGGASEDVLTRRVSSGGTALGSALSLGAQTADLYGPSVAYHPGANNYLVAWTDNRGGNWDAYSRLVDASGAAMGSAFALEATTADQIDVTLAKQGANQDLFLAYTDNRNSNPDLYGERYVPPIASFTATPPSGNAPLTVVFTDTSTAPNGITSLLWEFGDGVTSTLQNASHEYAAVGLYTVTLTATASLEADRNTQVITVNTPVTAQFVGSPLSGNRPLTVTFTECQLSAKSLS